MRSTAVAVLAALGGGCKAAPPTPSGTQPQPNTEVERLRARAKSDPVGVLIELGVTEAEFETIARALYFRWRAVFPAQAQAKESAGRAQPATIQQARWWCFGLTTGGSIIPQTSNCSRTVVDCERYRDYITANMEPSKKMPSAHFSKCAGQAQAACFRKAGRDGVETTDCSVNLDGCQYYRDDAVRDGVRVLSGCALE